MQPQTKAPTDKSAARPAGEKPQARIDVAQRLRDLRVPRGYRTARSLAKALGIDENRYTRYERAEVEPDLALIRRICQVLGITPTDLLGMADANGGHSASATGNGHAADPFSSPAHPSRDEQPVTGVRNQRAIGTEFAAWNLACAVAEARLGRNAATTDPRGGEQTSMALLALASPLFQKLRESPFQTIAELAADREIASAPPTISGRVLSSIDALVAALRERAD